MIDHIKEIMPRRLVELWMQPDTRLDILVYAVALSFAFLEGFLLAYSFETRGRMTKILIAAIPLFILIIALYQRISIQTTIGLSLLAFWIPLGIYAMELYLYEIFIYVIAVVLVIRFPRLDNDNAKDWERIKSFLADFPWFPFLLFIFGALLTWSSSTKTGGELTIIRYECIFPLALSLVLFISVRSTADAERYLWMILTSAAVLAVVFLVGRHFTSYITLSSYAQGSGRLSMLLMMPRYLGYMEMLPQKTSNFFGYLMVFVYSMWIFHPSPLRRAYALLLCALFGVVIIATQGRGGAVTVAIGAAVVTLYAMFSGQKFGRSGAWLKFAGVCLVVIGGLWYLSTHSSNIYFYQHGISLFMNPLQDENLIYRYQRLLDSINMFKSSPILGVGLRGYETPWGLDTSEVLNQFLYTLLGYGLLGFTGFVLILLRFLAAFWKGIRSGDYIVRMLCIACIAGMLAFFFGLQYAGTYSIVMIWAPLVLAYSAAKLNEKQVVKVPGAI